MNVVELRRLEVTLNQLKRVVSHLRQMLDVVEEQVNTVDFEVRVSLSVLHEENQLLKFRSDPFSNEGASLVDWEDISA